MLKKKMITFYQFYEFLQPGVKSVQPQSHSEAAHF
jgi:hypothetical protein